jgi:hypothetical protein
VLAGALSGTVVGSVAGPTAAPQAKVRVLHVAPVLTTPSAPLELAAAILCDPPDAVSCQVARGTAFVRDPSGSWTALVGAGASGAFRWIVPSELVGEQGFAYYLEVRTAAGQVVRYPEAGVDGPLAVETTAGFAQSAASLSWERVRGPDATAIRLGYGTGPAQVGRTDSPGDADVLTASSFDVDGRGRLYLADWVNGRVQVYAADGRLARTIGVPVRRTFDLSAGRSGLSLLTLGTDGTAYRLDADGHVLERTEVATGVATRIVGQAALVGPGQWLRVLGAGSTLAPLSSAPEGGPAFSQDLTGSAFAARWTSADGARVGAVVDLPEGFRVGPEYFVESQRDGGAVVARGVWDDTHAAVGVFTFDATGALVSIDLLPEPSARVDAVFSTVRWHAGDVYVARDRRDGLAIDVFEVR